jgi:hypothetical protein
MAEVDVKRLTFCDDLETSLCCILLPFEFDSLQIRLAHTYKK